MYDEFTGTTVLITGAGKRNGIGYGLARKMASCGANLVLTDVGSPPIENAPVAYGSMENLVAISKDLENEFGVKVLALEMDVTQKDSIDKAISAIDAEFGCINFLFNNAGAAIGVPQMTHLYDEDAWMMTMDVNLHGVFRVTKAAVPLMRKAPCAIVNVASRAGKTPAKLNGAYSVSKAGVIMMTKVMAQELAENNIRVNVICPGIIMTDLQVGNIFLKAVVFETSVDEAEDQLISTIPLNRIGTIDEVADLAAYLMSNQSSYITGQAINVGGGMLMEL